MFIYSTAMSKWPQRYECLPKSSEKRRCKSEKKKKKKNKLLDAFCVTSMRETLVFSGVTLPVHFWSFTRH